MKEYDVFICYAHADEDVAGKVLSALETGGLRCFIDKGGVQAGENWLTTIADAIQKSCIFMPLLSRSFNESDYSKGETQLALMEKKRGGIVILPYLIDDGVDEDMAREMVLLLGTVQWLVREEVPVGVALVEAIHKTLRGGFVQKISAAETPRVLETHCYYHPERGVAATCADCGKYLCRECADKYSVDGRVVPLCDDCFEHRREKRLKADREAAFAVLNEHEDKKRKFLIKFIISLVLFVIILVSLIDAREFGWTYLLLLLSFFPFGFRQGLAGLVEGSTPTVLYSDGTTDKGCLTGIILGLFCGIFGGLFIFIKDLFEILLFVKPEIPGDTQGTTSLEARRKDEPVDKADVPKWHFFIMIGVVVLAFIFIYFAFFK